MPYAQTNGIAIYYETVGRGPAVLLIGGLGADGHFWYKQAPALARHFQVITPDNRGAGQTEAPDESYTIRGMADDLAGLLDALQIPTAHVVGASLGGFVAQEFALAYSQRVGRLVLCCTCFGGPHSVSIQTAALPPRTGDPRIDLRAAFELQLAPDYVRAHAQELEAYIAWRVAHPQALHAYQRQLAAVAAHDTEARLGTLRLPVLILHGDRDNIIPAANAALMAGRIPGARVRLFPGAGHLFLWERMDDVNHLMTGFLNTHAR